MECTECELLAEDARGSFAGVEEVFAEVLKCSECKQGDEQAQLPLAQTLHDDALVAIFQRLPVSDVLRGASAVCRRWREAAGHEELWQRRAVPLRPQELPAGAGRREAASLARVQLSVVRRAQLLDLIQLVDAYPGILHLAAVTSCAAKELHMNIGPGDMDESVGVRVLQNQLVLGRLRRLELNVHGLDEQEAVKLAETLLDAADLTDLHLRMSGFRLPAVKRGVQLPATRRVPLETLLYHGPHLDDPFLLRLVSDNTATLRKVHLRGLVPLQGCAGEVLGLLRSCPRLQNVFVPLVPSTAGLSRLPRVQWLTLEEKERQSSEHESPSQIIRTEPLGGVVTSSQLRIPDDDVETKPDQPDGGTSTLDEMLPDLSDTSSELRSLCVQSTRTASLSRVLAALPRAAPQLRVLQLQGLPGVPHFLDALSPETTPSLRQLSVWKCHVHQGDTCWLPALEHLVRRNRHLHVTGMVHYHEGTDPGGDPSTLCSCDSFQCYWCRRINDLIMNRMIRYYTFFNMHTSTCRDDSSRQHPVGKDTFWLTVRM